jgi:hypothetical protein
MQRNQAALGTHWQERQRSWDERCGDYGPALPLLPLVCTGGILALVVGLALLLGGCAAYACAPAKLSGYPCPEPVAAVREAR